MNLDSEWEASTVKQLVSTHAFVDELRNHEACRFATGRNKRLASYILRIPYILRNPGSSVQNVTRLLQSQVAARSNGAFRFKMI